MTDYHLLWSLADAKTKSFVKTCSFTLFLIFSLVAIYVFTLPFGKIVINGSTSLSGSVYLLTEIDTVNKGQFAAFRPHPGGLYPDAMWFGKVVKGVEGDVVTVVGRDFYINGEYIGAAKEVTTAGDPIAMSDAGVIPKNHFFMWTPHEYSYDSRYKHVGLVEKSDLIGGLLLIF